MCHSLHCMKLRENIATKTSHLFYPFVAITRWQNSLQRNYKRSMHRKSQIRWEQ